MEMYDKIDKLRNKRWELTHPEQVMPNNLKALRLFIAKNFSRHKAENNKIPIITEQDRRHKHENAKIPIIPELRLISPRKNHLLEKENVNLIEESKVEQSQTLAKIA